MNRLLCQWAGGLLLGTLLLQSAHAVDVRAIRLWAGPGNTRVVVDLSGTAQHSVLLLHNPERIVLDVSGAHLAKSAHSAPPGAGAVKSVRMSHSPSGNLRVVLDLARPVQAKSFLSAPNAHYGYRLVVDLAGGVSRVADKPIKAKHAPSDARDLIIAIDAGHGGEDPGAIGKNGTREKDVVLAIARELAAKINGEAGMKAILTRGGDYFVPLRVSTALMPGSALIFSASSRAIASTTSFSRVPFLPIAPGSSPP